MWINMLNRLSVVKRRVRERESERERQRTLFSKQQIALISVPVQCKKQQQPLCNIQFVILQRRLVSTPKRKNSRWNLFIISNDDDDDDDVFYFVFFLFFFWNRAHALSIQLLYATCIRQITNNNKFSRERERKKTKTKNKKQNEH